MQRTDPNNPPPVDASLLVDRLPARLRVAARAALRMGWAGRIAWGAVGAVALAAIVYTASQPTAADLVALYGGGRSLARAEAQELAQTLEEAGIAAQVEADGAGGARVSVAREQADAAYKAVQKAGRRPRSLEELVDEPASSAGFLAPAAEVERQQTRRREQVVAAAIREVDSTLDPLVLIFREASRGLQRTSTTRVTVHLGTPDRRRIRSETIERIRVKVQAFVPELADDGLTMLDSAGTPYIQAGHPAVAERNALKAREEELTSAILEQLDLIEGVRVGVTIRRADDDVAIDESDPIHAVASVEAPTWPVLPPVHELTPPPSPAVAVAVNQPFDDLEEEPAPPPPPIVTAAADDPPAARADILVRVPSTYYASLAQQVTATTQSEPTLEDLYGLARQTETMIRRSVEMVVPASERGEIRVERILVPGPRRLAASASAAGREWSGSARWRPLHLAVAGGIALALAATAAVAAAGRRQRRRAVRRERRAAGPREPRYRVDSADAPGPSERVRDLVRLDPGAAAGVLNRWIAAGEGPETTSEPGGRAR
jgi:hypothetical protein